MRPRWRALAALGLGLAAASGCGASGERQSRVLFPDMVKSLSFKPYDPNPVLRRGQTLQLPAEGTVSIERTPFAFGPGPDEALRAGRELRNPAAATSAELLRGRSVYETICVVCHGPQGQGDGPIIGRFPNPPSLRAEHARNLPDGQIFHIVTRGQGVMPGHAAQVLPEDRWRVILYLRELQGAAGKPDEAAALVGAGGVQ